MFGVIKAKFGKFDDWRSFQNCVNGTTRELQYCDVTPEPLLLVTELK